MPKVTTKFPGTSQYEDKNYLTKIFHNSGQTYVNKKATLNLSPQMQSFLLKKWLQKCY